MKSVWLALAADAAAVAILFAARGTWATAACFAFLSILRVLTALDVKS